MKLWPFSKRTAGSPRRIRLPTRATILDVLREACLLAGFFMLGRGLWLIYVPLMWLVCGLLLLWVGLSPREKEGGQQHGSNPRPGSARP